MLVTVFFAKALIRTTVWCSSQEPSSVFSLPGSESCLYHLPDVWPLEIYSASQAFKFFICKWGVYLLPILVHYWGLVAPKMKIISHNQNLFIRKNHKGLMIQPQCIWKSTLERMIKGKQIILKFLLILIENHKFTWETHEKNFNSAIHSFIFKIYLVILLTMLLKH